MLAADRDALICDLAETYGIFDYQALPVPLLATLASGLREHSRIKMKMLGQKVPRAELLLAAAVDRLSVLCWRQTEDGRSGLNFPAMVLDTLLGIQADPGHLEAFETAQDFEASWALTTGVGHG